MANNNTPETFWARFDRGDGSGCWIWTGAVSSSGYGQMSYAAIEPRDRPIVTHRVAWILAHGPIPDGLFVLHHCDVRVCGKVEPDEQYPDGHLFLGTTQHNVTDMLDKGRRRLVVGSRHPNAKLTESQVVAIRQQRADGATVTGLAKRFGVSIALISGICSGSKWKVA